MGHFVVKRHHFLVWVFRPTLSPQDVSIDLDFESKPFLDGYAHGGMLQEAQTLFGRVWGIIKNHLDDESELILTGHSLGGSIAAIMCCMLRHGHPEISSYAFCFGAAPCLSRGISERFHPFMLGICVGDDVVVRLSYEGFVDLKKRLFLISKLNPDETVLQEQGHIHGHTWAHQKDLCTPERLWPPWKQIYVRREPERGLCVTKVNATDFACPVVSMRCLLDHAPITYDEILWEYMR